jgi:DNA-binding PadR family transcriptional regulator
LVIGKDLVAASATPLILSVLLAGESYGYDIIRQVRTLSGDRLDWSEGMIYPALRRLEQKGLLESRWVESEAGPRRKYYSITKQGKAALKVEKDAWLTVHSTLQALWGTPIHATR